MSDEIGSIIGYLALDRSDWDKELAAAGRKADELARHNPNIKISTNATSAIAQLNLVAAATKRLQDAQGAERVAEAKLAELRAKGTATGSQLATAEERLAKARRGTAAATIQLASAHDANERAMVKSVAETEALAVATRKVGDESNKAKPFAVNLWAALAAVAPAAVPIAGVAVGAIAGLIPVAVTAALGIKGISEEFKSGALEGTKYGDDIKSLSDELASLKQIAAGGILAGIDKGLADSKGLFGEINEDIGVMSDQLGQIIAGAGPALLQILTDLNPLFVTFGNLLSNGAQHLEEWAQSSTGVQSFVAYVQAELPEVMQFLGSVITLLAHLAQGAAPFGGVLLQDINLFIGALNKIPINVLATAIPVVISLYAAFKTYGAITAIVAGVNHAIDAMKGPFVSTAATAAAASATTVAASKAIELAKADEAVKVALANKELADSYDRAAAAMLAPSEGMQSMFQADAVTATEAAQAITDSWNGVASLFETDSTRIAAASREQAIAFQAAADAAIVSAEEIAAASTAAADTVVVEGKVASVGWTSMLGPIGAVVVGVALMSSMFLGNRKAAQDAAAAANLFADSVKTSTKATSLANVQAANKNLSDKGALDSLAKLKAATNSYGLSQANLAIKQSDLSTAVVGSSKDYDALAAKLKAVAAANRTYVTTPTGAAVANGYTKTGQEAQKLLGVVTSLRKGLADQIVTQEQLNSINASAAGITDQQAVSAARLYGLTGTDGVAAYLAAVDATKKNTDQTNAQTLAWQMANDAGSLLQQTIDKLAGKQLSWAQAQNSFQQQLVTMATSLQGGSKAVTGLSSAAIQNRGNLLSLVTGAQQAADAYGNLKQSGEAGRQKLIELRKQIIDNAVAHGEDRQAVTDYIDSVLKIPKSVPPTKVELDTKQAEADLAEFKRLTEQRFKLNVSAVISGGYANLGSGVKAYAKGSGNGGVKDGWFTVGEQGYEMGYKDGNDLAIFSHQQSVQMTGKNSVPGYAGGSGIDIHSPSRVLFQTGAHGGDGLALGLASKADHVQRSASLLASAAVPTIRIPGRPSSQRSTSAGVMFHQTINPQPYQSEREIGRASAAEFAWALRSR